MPDGVGLDSRAVRILKETVEPFVIVHVSELIGAHYSSPESVPTNRDSEESSSIRWTEEAFPWAVP